MAWRSRFPGLLILSMRGSADSSNYPAKIFTISYKLRRGERNVMNDGEGGVNPSDWPGRFLAQAIIDSPHIPRVPGTSLLPYRPVLQDSPTITRLERALVGYTVRKFRKKKKGGVNLLSKISEIVC
ncbi:hypothetical protein HOY82DRAFT_6330 [Tuber indicum]|nr:hypothetical protein HOY82DRAFT_6330 [Tuber indicum]